MTERGKLQERLPKGEQPITEVEVARVNEDGRHPGWLTLTPNWIVFLDERDTRHENDYIRGTDYTGAEISGDSSIGTIVVSWAEQGKIYEGNLIELRAFKAAIDDQLNP
jgi:hypothetical protein